MERLRYITDLNEITSQYSDKYAGCCPIVIFVWSKCGCFWHGARIFYILNWRSIGAGCKD
jgi:hypothetical protein